MPRLGSLLPQQLSGDYVKAWFGLKPAGETMHCPAATKSRRREVPPPSGPTRQAGEDKSFCSPPALPQTSSYSSAHCAGDTTGYRMIPLASMAQDRDGGAEYGTASEPSFASDAGPASSSPPGAGAAAALPAAVAAEAAGPSPLPPPPSAPSSSETVAALARLRTALEQQHLQRRRAAASAATAGAPAASACQPAERTAAAAPASLYLAYSCRSNPVCLLDSLEDSAATDCHVIVQAAASRRSTASSSIGSASPLARSSWGDGGGEEPLPGTAAAHGSSGSWAGLQQPGGELEILTVIPNAAYKL